jgi:hypothetical protein
MWRAVIRLAKGGNLDMHCLDRTLQTLLLDVVGSSVFASAMIKLMGLYKYLGYLT